VPSLSAIAKETTVISNLNCQDDKMHFGRDFGNTDCPHVDRGVIESKILVGVMICIR
jgi:hypothetical protein